jgi:hypothetical protein
MNVVRCFVVFVAASSVMLLSAGCGSDDPPTASDNHPPTISSITANPSTFHLGDLSTITVTATDPDGDGLQYYWDHRGESVLEWFSSTGNTAILTTCGCLIVDDLHTWVLATVKDGKGGEATDSVAVVVLAGEQ